jgi:hypothetical protein
LVNKNVVETLIDEEDDDDEVNEKPVFIIRLYQKTHSLNPPIFKKISISELFIYRYN